MASCPELDRRAADHPSARHSGWLNKRLAGSWIGGWHQRWCVCEGNFLYTYVTPKDTTVRKVVLLDGCQIDSNPSAAGKEFAICLTTRSGRKITFACEKEEQKRRWVSVLSAAAYDKMMQRSFAAKRFLDTCIGLMKPAAESDGANSAGDDKGKSGPDSAAAATPVKASQPGPIPGEPGMLTEVSTAQHVADSIVSLQRQRSFLRAECRRLADQLAGRGGALPGSAGASPLDAGGAAEADARRDRAARRAAEELDELRSQLRRVRLEADAARERAHAAEAETDRERARASVAESRLRQREGDGDGTEGSAGDGGKSGGKGSEGESAGAGGERGAGGQARDPAVELAALRAEREAQSRQVGRLRAEVEELRSKLKGVEEDVEKEKQQRRAAQEATDAAEAKAAGLRARAQAAERELEAARADIKRLGEMLAAEQASAAGRSGVSRLGQDGKSAEDSSMSGGGGTGTGGVGVGGRSGAGAGPAGDAAEESEDEDDEESTWAPFFREAQLLEKAGRYTDAQRQYEAVLRARQERSRERGNEGEGAEVAAALRDLGRVLALQQQFSASESRYNDAVRQCRRYLGPSHASTACALTDLAAVQREQGKFDLAEQNAADAVEALRLSMGKDDISTATALYNLGGLRRRQGKFDLAASAYLDALRVYERRAAANSEAGAKKGGEGGGEAADTLYQLGTLERRRGDWKAAGKFFNRAADAYSVAYGSRDRRVQEATQRARDMAQLMADQGQKQGKRGGGGAGGGASGAGGSRRPPTTQGGRGGSAARTGARGTKAGGGAAARAGSAKRRGAARVDAGGSGARAGAGRAGSRSGARR